MKSDGKPPISESAELQMVRGIIPELDSSVFGLVKARLFRLHQAATPESDLPGFRKMYNAEALLTKGDRIFQRGRIQYGRG